MAADVLEHAHLVFAVPQEQERLAEEIDGHRVAGFRHVRRDGQAGPVVLQDGPAFGRP
jgi:hypothetical protein